MLMHVVNGVAVPLSAQEESSIVAEWASNAGKTQPDLSDIGNQDKRTAVVCAVIAQLTDKPMAQVAAAFRAEWNKP